MNNQQIEYFLTTARCLNMTKAAEQLYVSQPAISKQIKAIEEELGVNLFIRNKGHIQLTPAGERLQELLPSVKAQFARVKEQVQVYARGFYGSLSIGVQDGLLLTPEFTSATKKLRRKNPNLNIEAFHSSYKALKNSLHEGLCDMAMLENYGTARENGSSHLVLASVKPMLVMHNTHRLAQREAISLAEITEETLQVSGEVEGLVEHITRAPLSKKTLPKIKTIKPDSSLASIVEMGFGIAVGHDMKLFMGMPYITCIPITDVSEFRLVMEWRDDNKNSALYQFIELLESELAARDSN